jgi:hypothetical protein
VYVRRRGNASTSGEGGMKTFLFSVCWVVAFTPPAVEGEEQWTIKGAGVELTYSTPDSVQAIAVLSDCSSGKERIERFFHMGWQQPVRARIFPDRESLTAYWRSAWKIPDLQVECWQVASGTGSMLAILSPRVWRTEACEHNADDSIATHLLIVHELVHMFHGQHNPGHEFEGMDDAGWFVDGLATYVSGQLERSHAAAARTAIAEGKDPAELKSAWSGRFRYGVCGSMAQYVDFRYGRGVLRAMLGAVTQQELLKVMGTSEAQFLSDWKRWVMSRPPQPE